MVGGALPRTPERFPQPLQVLALPVQEGDNERIGAPRICLALFALRACFVETKPDDGESAIFPSRGCRVSTPPSLLRVPSSRFPQLKATRRHYYEAFRLLPAGTLPFCSIKQDTSA